ncbi:hypothetical protein [Shewanella sp.]|uniref:hypothetical protein n=1 Tax=Shewanella sp. TaxID=50422 RepID=UPI002587F405|nr:hypothetical protein [Shewanella sp.]MCJ8305094.1 hypothetical protein [Shewanella sp.]
MSLEVLFQPNIITPIVVAFIGGLVAVTSAVIAKEHKVSEFRQAWINDLRDDIAELSSISFKIIVEKRKVKQIEKDQLDLLKAKAIAGLSFLDLLGEVMRVSTLIKLRLNTNTEHSAFISEINKLISLLHTSDHESQQDFDQIEKVQQIAHTVLKTEWERVKLGEKRFILFVTKGEFFGATFIIAFYVLFFLAKFPELFPGIK